jgi:hypothetical protein
MSLLALLLLACPAKERAPAEDSAAPPAEPSPWDDLAPIALDPARELIRASIDHGGAPQRLAIAPAGPTVLVLDDAGAVHLFDGRFRHSERSWCVPLRDWDHLEDGADRTGRCAADEAELQPGEWASDVPIAAVAASPDGAAWAIDAEGVLWRAALGWSASENPLDQGRLARVADTGLRDARLLSAGADGTVHVATADRIVTLGADGFVASELPFDAASDLLADDGHVWVAGPAGLVRDGAPVVTGAVARLASDGAGGVWVAFVEEGRLRRVDASGAVLADTALSGLVGPIARDPRDGRVRALTDAGFATVDADGALRATAARAPAVDLVVSAAGEIVLLEADGALAVLVDETALPSGPPLRVYIAGFVENPREEGAGVPCVGEDESIARYMETATRNRAWLDDVPATLALGITPTAARRARTCGYGPQLRAVAATGRTEAGVLFHDRPDCGTDADCLAGELADDVAAITSVGATPTWSSGLSSWDLEQDWVAGLVAAGAPLRLAFFGLGADPDVPHADPRAKEPLPWRGDAPPSGWSIDAGSEIAERAPGGAAADVALDRALTVWPGMNAPGFHLGACANLPIVICDRVRGGTGDVFDADDVAVLDLLLLRAMALRAPGSTSTWSFHLPAIEAWDYTEGCTEQDGVWSGEGCEAALLQQWAFGAHARFVAPGYLAWTLPSELP